MVDAVTQVTQETSQESQVFEVVKNLPAAQDKHFESVSEHVRQEERQLKHKIPFE